jgi:hypothetical protein
MKELLQRFCPDDYRVFIQGGRIPGADGSGDVDMDEEEEEEEEEE